MAASRGVGNLSLRRQSSSGCCETGIRLMIMSGFIVFRHPEPPNYHASKEAHAPFCRDCEFYEEDRCRMYDVPVVDYYSCDSWKRNPKRPAAIVRPPFLEHRN